MIPHFSGFPSFFPSVLSQSLMYSSFALLSDGILHCLVLSFLLLPGHSTCCFLFLEYTPPPPPPLPLVIATHLLGCSLDFTSSRKSSLTSLHPNYNRYLLWPTCTGLEILEYVFPSNLYFPIIASTILWGNCLSVCLVSSKKRGYGWLAYCVSVGLQVVFSSSSQQWLIDSGKNKWFYCLIHRGWRRWAWIRAGGNSIDIKECLTLSSYIPGNGISQPGECCVHLTGLLLKARGQRLVDDDKGKANWVGQRFQQLCRAGGTRQSDPGKEGRGRRAPLGHSPILARGAAYHRSKGGRGAGSPLTPHSWNWEGSPGAPCRIKPFQRQSGGF